jgi:CBS domain-containing protein|tara:strand:- start:375 stop:776 length:402 start_codon:yes stop_codon:yes gene_type:complete
MATIGDVMTKDVVTLSSDSTVTDAAQVMVRGGFGSVVVVHGRMLLGILTERDVLRAAASEDDLRSALVERWMTPDPDTSEPDLDTEEAAGLMLSRGYRHLPVVVDGDLVGMVSLRDVLSARIARSRGVDLGGP